MPTLLSPMALQAFVDQFLVDGLSQWAVLSVITLFVAMFLMLWLSFLQGIVARQVTQSVVGAAGDDACIARVTAPGVVLCAEVFRGDRGSPAIGGQRHTLPPDS